MNKDYYAQSLEFWNSAFALSTEDREKHKNEITAQSDPAAIGISMQLADFVKANLAHCTKVLDYGCGEGWAGMSLSRQGCGDVTCVDLAQNAVETVKYLAALHGIHEGFTAMAVDVDWLGSQNAETYDGIVCTCVLDVVPSEICKGIIENLAKVCKKGGTVVIGLNYYAEPVDKPEKNIYIKNGNELYLDGILRMVTRTDEEWKQLFALYFDIEKLEYYAWNSESEKRRRMFVLKRK